MLVYQKVNVKLAVSFRVRVNVLKWNPDQGGNSEHCIASFVVGIVLHCEKNWLFQIVLTISWRPIVSKQSVTAQLKESHVLADSMSLLSNLYKKQTQILTDSDILKCWWDLRNVRDSLCIICRCPSQSLHVFCFLSRWYIGAKPRQALWILPWLKKVLRWGKLKNMQEKAIQHASCGNPPA